MAEKQIYKELRQKEAKLCEERYRAIVENQPEMICCFLPDGTLTFVNDAYCRYFKKNRMELIGYNFKLLIPESDRDKVLKKFSSLNIDNSQVTHEHQAFNHLGEIRCHKWTNRAIFDNQNNLKAYHAVGWDITEQKEIEERLRNSEERLKDFIHSATDAFVLFDSELNIIEMNKIHMDMFHPGMGKKDLIGKNLLEIVPNLKETGRINDFFEVIETGRPFYAKDIVPHQKFGNRRLSVKAFKVADGLGTITRDITERKLTEEALRKAHEELEQRVEERTRALESQRKKLVEINTALNVLLIKREEDKILLQKQVVSNVKTLAIPYIEKIKKGKLNETQKAMIDVLESNLHEIVSPFSHKLSSDYFGLTPAEIKVADLVRQGKQTKEIASMRNLSRKTIERHRENIRKKLGIKNKRINLLSYLTSAF